MFLDEEVDTQQILDFMNGTQLPRSDQAISRQPGQYCTDCDIELVKTSDKNKRVCNKCGRLYDVDFISGESQHTTRSYNQYEYIHKRNLELGMKIRTIIDESKFASDPRKEDIINDIINVYIRMHTHFTKRQSKHNGILVYTIYSALIKHGHDFPISAMDKYFPNLRVDANLLLKSENTMKAMTTYGVFDAYVDTQSAKPDSTKIIADAITRMDIHPRFIATCQELYNICDRTNIYNSSTIKTKCVGCIYIIMLIRPELKPKIDMLPAICDINSNTYKRFASYILVYIPEYASNRSKVLPNPSHKEALSDLFGKFAQRVKDM